MTFLNPLALFGLLAAAIPILLHLLNLRKLRTIEFSTLSFLKELEKTKIRRLKLRQLLLLILRTLLVILLVLAFARPTLRGTIAGSMGAHARTTAVFILDDSYSMSVSDERGELLKQARQAALGVVNLLRDGDEVFLLPLSSLRVGEAMQERPIRDFELLRKSIGEIKLTARRQPLEDALRMAARLLAGTSNYNKEIYLFSDFQQGVLTDQPSVPSKDKLFPPETRIFSVPLGKRGIQNFGVESVTIPSSIFERDKPFTIRAGIGNYSGSDAQDHVVSVFLDGTRVAERSVDLPRGAIIPVEFSIAASRTGFVDGFVEIEDDDFQYDNRRSFALQIPDRVRVLLVGLSHDMQFPRLALATQTSASESPLEISETAPDRLTTAHIKKSDVIILCSSEGLSSAQVSELSSFVSSGGGLVLFPGAQVIPDAFNALMAIGLGLPIISAIDRPSAPNPGVETFLEFDKVELRHPLFEGMFESGTEQTGRPGAQQSGRRVESPRIRISARFNLSGQSNPIITLANGAAFLTEQRNGAGRMLLFAVPPTTDWSDFPMKGVFVPLIHRSVLYLARTQSRAEDVLPGSEIVLRSSAPASGTWTIRDPGKIDLVASPVSQAFQQTLRFRGTDQPGTYSVLAEGAVIQKFVVNLDPRESEIQKASGTEIGSLYQRLGIEAGQVRESGPGEELDRAVLASRFGTELWKYFLIMALIVALLELLIARSPQQKQELVSGHD